MLRRVRRAAEKGAALARGAGASANMFRAAEEVRPAKQQEEGEVFGRLQGESIANTF